MSDRFAGFCCTEVQDVPVLWQPDPRFKTFRLGLWLQRPGDHRTAARALLPSLLAEGTRRHPDRTALLRAQELLYGAVVACGSGKLAETTVLQLVGEAPAGAFLPGQPDQLGAVLALMAELLLQPALDADGGFPADRFARERDQLLAAARAQFEDKAGHAWQRLLQLGCAGEPYAVPEHGGEDAIAALDRLQPEAARQDFLRHGRGFCVAMGALPDDLPARLEPLLAGFAGRTVPPPSPPVQVPRRPSRSAREGAVMQQSRLAMLLRLPLAADAGELAAQQVMASLFGGGPHSRLFTEVREKRSLAYQAGASLHHHKGVMVVQCGLDAGAAPAVEAEVVAQLQALARGEFSARELATAKAQLSGRLPAIDDALASRLVFTQEQWLLGHDLTPAGKADVVAAVTADGVAAAAAAAWPDFTFLLAAEPAP